jgi:hypothetical protein
MKKKKLPPQFEKISVGYEQAEQKAKELESEKLREKKAEDDYWKNALKEHVDPEVYQKLLELKEGKPNSLDDLRKIRQRKNEEEMGE